jgi:integrase
MELKRLRQNGDNNLQGGLCTLLWPEDAIGSNGAVPGRWREPAWIGPATGPERQTTERPDQHDRVPQSLTTIADFVENLFVPEHVATKGLSGRTHFQAILKHVLPPEEVDRMFHVDTQKSTARLTAVPDWPYLGKVRLCDTRPDDVQRLISAALDRGYSTQTVTHIRNVVSAIFEHAKKKQWFAGDNPALKATLPVMTRKGAHALTLAEAKEVLGAMQYPEKEMALITVLTNMNVSEICGVQWKHVNLTEAWSHADGASIPPRTIAVRKQWYLGELSTVTGKRNRIQPIPEPLLPILLELSRRDKYTKPDDFVLVSRAGTPIKANNIVARRLKPIGKDLQIPRLSWNVIRRSRSTLAYELGTQGLGDRVA